jgi:hypothetical protein
MLRVLKAKQSTFLGKITKFEGSIDDAVNGCKYDITFNNGTKVTFGEFKSYKAESLGNFLKSGGDTYQQFTTLPRSLGYAESLAQIFICAH